jgi:hypothetical protein
MESAVELADVLVGAAEQVARALRCLRTGSSRPPISWRSTGSRTRAIGRHLGAAVRQRVEVAGGDHEQRHPLDAVVGEPVADQGAVVVGGRLDVVEGDGKGPGRPAAPRPRGAAGGGWCEGYPHPGQIRR